MRAWHFLKNDMTGRCGNEPAWKDGQKRTVEGDLVMCQHGYHASKRLIDALEYARGSTICRVEVSRERLKDTDKVCARWRRLLWHLPAEVGERILHEFACWCAEQALKRERKAGREPDPRSWQAIETKRKWLRGEASDQELYAARDAARAAARDAAWAAARDAARAAQNRKLTRMIMAARKAQK